MLGGNLPTSLVGKFTPFVTHHFNYIIDNNMKEWDLLTVERDGEMLISSERGVG